jgi:2'-5' RNA ligase
MEPKRLFIALPVVGQLGQEAKNWQDNHFGWPVRWLANEDLHITVISPWLEDDLDLLISKLDKFVSTPRDSVTLNFEKVVWGPNRISPRLIWAEGKSPVALLELKNRLEQALARPDHRFYRLHLTRARFKLEDFGPAGLPQLADLVDWNQEIKSFSLFESEIGPDGPKYRKIKDFNFDS